MLLHCVCNVVFNGYLIRDLNNLTGVDRLHPAIESLLRLDSTPPNYPTRVAYLAFMNVSSNLRRSVSGT